MRFPMDEVSGLAPSRRFPGVYWAIRDSGPGNRETLLAIRIENGRAKAWPDGAQVRVLSVQGATNHDWEDLALDEGGQLWIADTGNNRGNRKDLALLRVSEPNPWEDRQVQVTEQLTLHYPDAPREGLSWNTEALFFHGGRGWLMTKEPTHGLYRFSLHLVGSGSVVPERMGSLTPPAEGFRGLVTGAALSDDGQRLAVSAGRRRLWIYDSPSRTEGRAVTIQEIVSAAPRWSVPYGPGQSEWQVEAVCFRPKSHDVLVAAEEGPVWYLPALTYEQPWLQSLDAAAANPR